MTARQHAICRGDVLTPERCEAIRTRWAADRPATEQIAHSTVHPTANSPQAESAPPAHGWLLTRFEEQDGKIVLPALVRHAVAAWSDTTRPQARRGREPEITLVTVPLAREQRESVAADPDCCLVPDPLTESGWQAVRGWLLAQGLRSHEVEAATGLQYHGDLRRLTGDLANWLRRRADDPISCIHRGDEPTRTIPCRPCRGASQVPAYRCGYYGTECTVRAFGATGEDGRKLPVCLGCEHQVPPEPSKPESSKTSPAPVRSTSPPRDAPVVTGFLFDSFGRPCDHLADQARGGSVFLCCGGPSLADMPLDLLQQRGIVIAAVNNAGAVNVRPHLWFSVDSPGRFHESLWRDPAVRKFTRRAVANGILRSRVNGEWQFNGTEARHCPETYFYEHTFGFTADGFLAMPKLAWGGKAQIKGKDRDTKSVFLVALRLLYWLGYRRVYLLGADFHYRPERTYSFSESKNANGCGTNNNTMRILDEWLTELRPRFEAAGFGVYNTTPGSRLTAFDHVDLADAVLSTALPWPSADDVAGMYSGC